MIFNRTQKAALRRWKKKQRSSKSGESKRSNHVPKSQYKMISSEKTIIFSAAGGKERYCYWAKTLLNSVRNIGNFCGDFCVFTDRESFFADSCAISRNHIIPISFNDGYMYNHIRFLTKYIKIMEQFNWDFIIYCDSDIVCVNDISPIISFAYDMLKGKIGYVRESLNQSESFYSSVMDLYGLEHLYQGKYGIDAGFFICDRSVFWEYMQIWEKEYNKVININKKLLKRNQSVFNYLIESEKIKSLEIKGDLLAIPEYYLKRNLKLPYKERINDSNIFYHIVGISDSNVHNTMKKYYNSNKLSSNKDKKE